MDPLSILGTVIALVGVTSATVSKVKQIYGSHRECNELLRDLDDAKILFREVERCVLERQGERGLSQDGIEYLCCLLETAKSILQSLNNIAADLVGDVHPDGRGKPSSLRWTRQRSKIMSLREQLRNIQESVKLTCALTSLSDLARIYSCLVKAYEASQNNFETLQSSLADGRRDISPHKALNNGKSNSTDTPSAFGIASIGMSMTASAADITTTSTMTATSSTDGATTRSTWTATTEAVTSGPRAPQYRRKRCGKFCSCKCHKLHHFSTPQTAATILGWLLIGYSGWPTWYKCSERTCRRQSVPTVAMAYYFPQWFIGRMIHFAFSISYMNGPQISLATPRVIGGNSDIFTFSIAGNLEGVKSLFDQGLASPFDVCETNGRTPLHYAAAYSHRELSQYLIHSGARENLEDREQATAISLCWARIFKGLLEQREVDQWRVMLNDEDFLESRTFPSLHKIILGMMQVSLRQQLELSTVNVDDQDADGRTALSWAAAKSDFASVRTLLEHGADPNVCSFRGQSALHFAAQNPSSNAADIIQALLDKGAAVNCTDYWRRSALLYAGCNQDEARPLELLIDAGAHIDTRDCRERTPLGYAARMNKPRAARLLLSRGADTSIPDHWGLTPLCEVITNNHHGILQDLLARNIKFSERTVDGATTLHLAAMHADEQTLQLLAQHAAVGMDCGALDRDGFTAERLFAQRSAVSALACTAFGAIVEQAGRLSATGGILDDDSEDVFYDALDGLVV